MSKRRLKFSKRGMGKYISHLDLLRAFTRAISRADLPVRYTQGFNPHQIMTFSLPLPIGVTSECEFVDVDFEESAENDEIMSRLNETLPPDIRILSVGALVKSAANIAFAEYEIMLRASFELNKEAIEGFFKQEEIPVTKKTKKGDKEVNLAEYIRSVKIDETEETTLKMTVCLAAGGAKNIKPDIMISSLEGYLNLGEFDEVKIHRTKIFTEENGNLSPFE